MPAREDDLNAAGGSERLGYFSRDGSRGEGAAAATTARRLRILEDESLADESFLEVECRIREIEKALGVHEDARAVLFDDFVAVARLCFEAHGVRKARTAAALHADTQSAGVRGDAFLGEQVADFLGRFFGDVDHKAQLTKS